LARCGLNFDFVGAGFDGDDISGAKFSGGTVSFAGAEFSGQGVSFGGAEFSGGTVSFSRAEFGGGTVDFAGAEFSGGTVDFADGRVPRGPVSFAGAGFSGGTVDFARVASWTQPGTLAQGSICPIHRPVSCCRQLRALSPDSPAP
jgi:hypothetical protein